MRSSGSPQSASGLFGGPAFLVICLLIVGAAGGIAYLALTGGLGMAGRATISLPGGEVSRAQQSGQGQIQPASGGVGQLQSMPDAPVAKEISVSVAIEEDLSPAELLAKYPPDPAVALSAAPGDQPAWRRFGRKSDVSLRAPRVALVISGLGRDRIDTVRAITGAPPEASLSFAGDAVELAGWIAAARAFGHEALLDLPLQTDSAAPGDGLALSLGAEENLQRLDAMLARAPMIAGVTVAGGDSFLADAGALQPVLKHLQAAGLAVIGLPITAPLTLSADETIAGQASESDINESIRSVMALASRQGAALGIVDSSSTATLFPAWHRALIGRDEISLVPVSGLVKE